MLMFSSNRQIIIKVFIFILCNICVRKVLIFSYGKKDIRMHAVLIKREYYSTQADKNNCSVFEIEDEMSGHTNNIFHVSPQ